MVDSWDFLDEMDFNLLYRYAEVIKAINERRGKQLHSTCNNLKTEAGDIREKEIAEIKIAKDRKMRAWYLIWFVYRYVLKCETLEDTIPYQNEETLSEYRIKSYIQNHIYLGADEDSIALKSGAIVPLIKIWFRYVDDIGMILEILYNRYNFYEQFECFIRHTDKSRKKRAIEALEKYKELERIFYGS